MQLEMGSTPAPGVATRRPRRVAAALRESLNGESFGQPGKWLARAPATAPGAGALPCH